MSVARELPVVGWETSAEDVGLSERLSSRASASLAETWTSEKTTSNYRGGVSERAAACKRDRPAEMRGGRHGC